MRLVKAESGRCERCCARTKIAEQRIHSWYLEGDLSNTLIFSSSMCRWDYYW